jgi:hypothetical protein
MFWVTDRVAVVSPAPSDAGFTAPSGMRLEENPGTHPAETTDVHTGRRKSPGSESGIDQAYSGHVRTRLRREGRQQNHAPKDFQ